jgi:hypothetical protein
MNKDIKDYMELHLQEHKFAEAGRRDNSHATVVRDTCFKYRPDSPLPDPGDNACAGITRVLQ